MATKFLLKKEFQDSNLYKESTIRSYVNSIYNVLHYFGLKTLPSEKVSSWFKLPLFFDLFEHVKNLSKRNYLGSIISLLKLRGEESDPLFEDLSKSRDSFSDQYSRIVEKGELTQTEELNWVDFDVLANIYPKVKDYFERIGFFKKGKMKHSSKDYSPSEIKKIKDSVIVSIYTYPFFDKEGNFGILRNLISTLHLWNGKKKLPDIKKNYFRLSKGKGEFVLQNHKTERTHGTIMIELPDEITQILKSWTIFCEIGNGDRLFPGMEKIYITNLLQGFFKKHVGKKLSTQMLRKIYISGRFGKQHTDQAETASNMGHSTNTQQSVYSKKV